MPKIALIYCGFCCHFVTWGEIWNWTIKKKNKKQSLRIFKCHSRARSSYFSLELLAHVQISIILNHLKAHIDFVHP